MIAVEEAEVGGANAWRVPWPKGNFAGLKLTARTVLSCAIRPSATTIRNRGREKIACVKYRRQVAISSGVGLFCGGTQRTALTIAQSASLSPSSGRRS